MFLQTLPPDNILTFKSVFENQTGAVLLGLAIAVFFVLRITKFLSTIKMKKRSKNHNYTSQ